MENQGYTEVKQAWGEWLTDLSEWDWFVTMTLRDPVFKGQHSQPGWATAKRAWRDFTEQSTPALGGLEWVRMFEPQKWRGVPHIHALVGKVDPTIRRLDLVDWAGRNYGWARVEQYDREKGAAFYLCKYVTKDIADIDFSNNLVEGRSGEGRKE